MNSVRKRRLIVASLILGAGMVAGSLIALALQSNINYLHSPSEVIAGEAPATGVFRIGGVVLEESIQSGRVEATREVEYRFTVTDREAEYPVIYRGVLPDLFREGQSVIAKGRIEENIFIADQVLAKHDETYMPAEVADKMTQARIARAQQLKDQANQPLETPTGADQAITPQAAAGSGAP
ncbi:cytochrome c maturation protein CcmE [Aquimonas sp.]|jgi:cytochrome c-type biogenesis protein CcmE|uniref:cytochrome c maturation protein CcmE n=1 Tax=Aquimonas sp. TaxID=1872588 RepID=UPI0037C01C9F